MTRRSTSDAQLARCSGPLTRAPNGNVIGRRSNRSRLHFRRTSSLRGRSLRAAQEDIPCRRVHEVDLAAAEAAGQQDAVGALDVAGELGLGDAAADDAVVGLVALADPSPIHRAVDEVGADDDAT